MNSRWKLSKKTYIIAASIIVGLVILGIAAQFLIKASADTTPKTYTISNNATLYQSQNLAITNKGVLSYATVGGTAAQGIVTTKISNIVKSDNNTHWMDGQQRLLSALTDAQLAQVTTTLNGIAAPTYNGVTTSPSLQGNNGVGLVMQIAPPTGIPTGVKINSVSATLYQGGAKEISQVGLSNSLANTQTEMSSGSKKCAGSQCVVGFDASSGTTAWTAADLNNLSIGIMPQPASPAYGLDKLVISVNYSSTDLQSARVKPTLDNMTDSLSPTTVWNNAIIQGGVTIPTGTVAKIRWYVSNSAIAADAMANKDYAASSLGAACDSGVTCSVPATLNNNPTGSTTIQLNRIVGQYATFVLSLYAPATAKPLVYNQIQVNFTVGAASAPAPVSVCPAITTFAPITVAANPANQILTVNGADFGTTTGQIYLQTDGSTNKWVLIATSWTATKITANLPTNLPAGTYSVYVAINNCSVTKSSTALVVTAGTVTPTSPSPTCAPIVTGISTIPSIAIVGHTPQVYILGTGFGVFATGANQDVYLVPVGGTATYPLQVGNEMPWWTDTKIAVAVPTNTPAGTYNIYLKVGTCAAVLAGQITIVPAAVTPPVTPPVASACPSATGISKPYFNATKTTKLLSNKVTYNGTAVTITGANLGTAGTINMVSTADPAEKIKVTGSWSDGQITVQVPLSANKIGAVSEPITNLQAQISNILTILQQYAQLSMVVKPYYFEITPSVLPAGCVAAKTPAGKYVWIAAKHKVALFWVTLDVPYTLP